MIMLLALASMSLATSCNRDQPATQEFLGYGGFADSESA
jgi:hypothetical protein